MEIAVLALGCFWGPEIKFSKIEGVIKTPIPLDSISDETYIDIEGLNIKSFLNRGHIHDYMTFLNYPCYQFIQQHVSRNSHLIHIVLPENDSIQTYQHRFQRFYLLIPAMNPYCISPLLKRSTPCQDEHLLFS